MRLRQLWATLFRELGSETPSLTQFYVWLTTYPPLTIELAIHSCLKKAFYMSQRGEEMNSTYQLNYVGKTMKMITEQQIATEMEAAPKKVIVDTPPPVKKNRKPVINPFTGLPHRNVLTGQIVYEEE